MSEENVPEAPQEQSITDIATKFNIQELTDEFQAKPQQTNKESPTPGPIPDPMEDREGYRQWASQAQNTAHDVRQTLHTINERLTKQDQERIQGKEEADLKAAVSALKDGNDALDDETVEVYLGVKARKDKALLNIWKQRDKKPEAWAAALNVLKQDISKKFNVKSDPQLAENQRAMKVSRDQMATTRKADPNAKWSDMKPAEFEREWANLIQGG
jgi:hypothetical protein